ncbi:hypothetical protein [Streptomyces sp. NPDC059258]|uniref:hypothetical protein n=1 Tax=unclassified Streptomyces TaxID=2593676 RepID=UPI00369B86F2
MTDTITAPWSSEQVAALEQFQTSSGMHPFTCGADRHTQPPSLVPSRSGWYCPDPACDYRQDWAHAFMADPAAWPRPFGDRHGPTPEEVRNGVKTLGPFPVSADTLADVQARQAWEAQVVADHAAMTRRRALAFNAVQPVLAKHDRHLPLSIRQEVADAVLAAVDGDTGATL